MTAAIGILGGTFDPVHNAHLALAQAAMAGLGLTGVRWIPSGRPGHRIAPSTPVEHRLAMLRLALAGEARFTLDDSDARSAEPTYTINTLARLRRELGEQIPFAFIIGADQLVTLDRWCDWQRLFDATHFAVAERPGYPIALEQMSLALAAQVSARSADGIGDRPAGGIVRFAMPPSAISATAIRDALAKHQQPACSLPAAVLAYIQTHHLYSDSIH
ncbi:MAG: nicotinate-nucleotide adenylyltransferase [Proteobacteria bacterium]|nr:nicotinate-nucleotide adenylyltransferase [Pseudomonadota bacterium]